MYYKLIFVMIALILSGCVSSTSTQQEYKRTEDKTLTAANLNVQLGMGYLSKGQLERAKEKLLLAMHEAPNWPPALVSMGYFYEKSGDIEDARKLYERAVSLDAGNGLVQNDYGTFLCRHGQYSEAEYHFLSAVHDRNYVNTADAYENAGLCALQSKNETKAEAFFKKALDQDPLRTTSLFMLGQLYYNQGNYKSAKDVLSMIRADQTTPETRQLQFRIQKKLSARGMS